MRRYLYLFAIGWLILLFIGCDLPFLKSKEDLASLWDLKVRDTNLRFAKPSAIKIEWNEISLPRFKKFIFERGIKYESGWRWEYRGESTDSLQTSFTDSIVDDLDHAFRVKIVNKEDNYRLLKSSVVTVPNISLFFVPQDTNDIQYLYKTDFVDPGDTLIVSPGTYRQNQIFLTKPITLIGDGNRNQILFMPDQIGIPVVQIYNCSIEGITIKYGKSYIGGGGIKASGESSIINCIVSNNRALEDPGVRFPAYPMGYGGGAMVSGTTVIRQCDFKDNFSRKGGGNILIEGNAQILDSFIRRGKCIEVGGAGIYDLGDTVQITRTKFKRNLSFQGGGGIYQHSGRLEIQNSIFAKNNCRDNGGGIYIRTTTKTSVINSVFWNNGASNYGAFNENKKFTLLNSCIWDNASIPSYIFLQYHAQYCDIQDLPEAGIPTCISTPPQFINEISGNFRLNEYSQLRDAGHPGVQYFDNDGTRNDIGAYGGPESDE